MAEERDEPEVPKAPPPSGHPQVDTEDPKPETGDVEVPATTPTDDEGRPAPPAAS